MKVLVANRGEIAVRVIRACRDVGFESVAVYTDADAGAPHVRLADSAVGARRAARVSGPSTRSSAAADGCDAVHPGYGFLAENAAFAQAVEDAGLTFVGPEAGAHRADGRQGRRAQGGGRRGRAGRAGVRRRGGRRRGRGRRRPSRVPGRGQGRGGRRRARDPDRRRRGCAAQGVQRRRRARPAARSATSASTSSASSSGRGTSRCRCSATSRWASASARCSGGARRSSRRRRRRPTTRPMLCAAAASLAGSIGYRGAGTLEFLVDDATGDYFFIEMNTRIQVEHPVTELVTGVDLVAAQLTGELPAVRAARLRAGAAAERRGPGQQVHALAGQGAGGDLARRAVGARRHVARTRRRGPAVLRLAARQADRLGAGPRRRVSRGRGGRCGSSRSTGSRRRPRCSRGCWTRTGSSRGEFHTTTLEAWLS